MKALKMTDAERLEDIHLRIRKMERQQNIQMAWKIGIAVLFFIGVDAVIKMKKKLG
jgi:hypothetical protein